MSEKTERVTPQNIDAEKSLLGAILMNDEVLADVTQIVKPQDFYDAQHQEIYDAIWSLYERRRPVDLLTVKDELKRRKSTAKAGGIAYVTSLASYVPTSAHAKAYAEMIAESATRRRLISAASKINEQAFDTQHDVKEIIGNAEKVLFGVSQENLRTDLVAINDLLSDAFDRFEELNENKGSIAGYRTGFPDIDRITAGLHPSDLIILAARPAMGKTALALNLVRNVAQINQKHVLMFSLEMSKEQLINRIISDASGVETFKLTTGGFKQDDFQQMSEAMDSLAELPILIDDTPGLTIMEMLTKSRRALHENGELGLIVVDYLQLMQGSSRRAQENRVQEISEISRGLKLIARELNVPVIALSQLSRQVESRESKIPMLSDLRESGSIEQDADIVLFIHREDYYDENTDRQNIADIIIAKHRRGTTGRVELYFDKARTRFMSLDNKHQES
ncbi:replicative DNA helicase [Candidatus Saccharibacteria bacterium]|nr:replicative DNA helicase [Candidatus Saccharibacteria bacterium]